MARFGVRHEAMEGECCVDVTKSVKGTYMSLLTCINCTAKTQFSVDPVLFGK